MTDGPSNEGRPRRAPIAKIHIGKRHRRDLGDVDGLAASIAELGLLHPVVIGPDGALIAGERRLEACKALGWTHVPVTVVELHKIARGEFAENAVRKDFTLSEAVAIKRALEPIERAAAKERMRAGKPSEKFSEGRGNALDKIAQVAGKHRTTLTRAEAIVAAAEREPDKYGHLLRRMDKTGRVNGVFKQLKIAQQVEQIRAEPPPLPKRGPYRVIVADPPWPYEVREEDPSHRAVRPYPSMSLEQICAMNVTSLAHDDAILFLWTTNYHLLQRYPRSSRRVGLHAHNDFDVGEGPHGPWLLAEKSERALCSGDARQAGRQPHDANDGVTRASARSLGEAGRVLRPRRNTVSGTAICISVLALPP